MGVVYLSALFFMNFARVDVVLNIRFALASISVITAEFAHAESAVFFI